MSDIVDKQAIIDFMSQATLEITPGAASKIDDFRTILKPQTIVYVTFLPGSDFAETIATVAKLKSQDMCPVPHFAARSIPSEAFLRDNLDQLQTRAQVREALLIGGGVDKPVGEFTASIEVMQTNLFQKFGIYRLGIAGHPEGSPDISDADIILSLRQKSDYAKANNLDLYIATQFCFAAAPIFAWERHLRANGNQLPIHVGVPGLATVKTLLKHAQACGIGASMNFLRKQAKQVARLLTVNAPDELVRDLATSLKSNNDNADCRIHRPHIYPLGGLNKSATWLYAVQEGRFSLNKKGGFDAHI